MKRILSAVLSLLLLVSLAHPVQAAVQADRPPDGEMNVFLLERGFPADYLEGLTPQQVEDLYYLAYKNHAYYLSTTEQPVIQPYGNIPSDQLYFGITCLCSYKKTGGVTYIDEVFVYISYNWDTLTAIRKIDAIAVNWDSNILVYNGKFTAKDLAFSLQKNAWITYKTWDRPATIAQGGLGIYTYIDYAETTLGTSFPATGLQGSVTFSLKPKSDYTMEVGQRDRTSVGCEYVHDKNPLVSSVSFTYQGVGVYVDVGLMQDKAGTNTQINYIKH